MLSSVRRKSPLNNKDEMEEKIIDSIKESSTKKIFSNPQNRNFILKNENNADIYTGENIIFDLGQYFQEEESYLNYQDNFPHEDIDLLIDVNAQRMKLSNIQTKSPSLNNKTFESESQPADSTVNESPNHKEKNVSMKNVIKTNNIKRKRGRPKTTLDEKDLSIKKVMEKNQTEKKKIEFFEKNDHHIKELHKKELNGKEVADQNYNKKAIANLKNYDAYEKGNQVKNNRREKDEFKFETPKGSFKDNSSLSNDRIPFAEKYIQNFTENQNILQKPENSSPTQNMGSFQNQYLSFPPPKLMQSNNIDVQNFHGQDNLILISDMNPQNQFFDELNCEDNIQCFRSNYLKLDQFNQSSSLNNYNSINKIQTQSNSLNNYGSVNHIHFQSNPLNNYDPINHIQTQPNSLNNYGSVNHVQLQSNSINNYDIINQTQIQPKPLNNYDLSKQIQSNSLNNYDSIKLIQPISLNNYEPNSYPPFSDFNNEKKLTIYQNEYSGFSLNKDYNHNCIANLIDIQNSHQLQIEEMVMSIAVNEPSIILKAMTNSKLILNPFQLNFEPQSFWQDIHKDFTFGELVNKFFRLKNTQIAKFIYKLYDMLLITTKIPFYKGIIGISWMTDRIFLLNVQFFASLLNIPYLQIDSVLFGPNGNFTVLGFAEVTPQNFQQAGLGSFPNISEQNFKLMFHIDYIFIKSQLNTQILDCIDNHYQSKIRPISNRFMIRPKYPGFSS